MQGEDLGEGGFHFTHHAIKQRLIGAHECDEGNVGVGECHRATAKAAQPFKRNFHGVGPARGRHAKADGAGGIGLQASVHGGFENAVTGLDAICGASVKACAALVKQEAQGKG